MNHSIKNFILVEMMRMFRSILKNTVLVPEDREF